MDCEPSAATEAILVFVGMAMGAIIAVVVIAYFHWRRQRHRMGGS